MYNYYACCTIFEIFTSPDVRDIYRYTACYNIHQSVSEIFAKLAPNSHRERLILDASKIVSHHSGARRCVNRISRFGILTLAGAFAHIRRMFSAKLLADPAKSQRVGRYRKRIDPSTARGRLLRYRKMGTREFVFDKKKKNRGRENREREREIETARAFDFIAIFDDLYIR